MPKASRVTNGRIREGRLHEPQKFVLAIVSVTSGFAHAPRHVRGPLVEREPSFLETAIQFDLKRLLDRAKAAP